jgi:hypothetical protein
MTSSWLTGRSENPMGVDVFGMSLAWALCFRSAIGATNFLVASAPWRPDRCPARAARR